MTKAKAKPAGNNRHRPIATEPKASKTWMNSLLAGQQVEALDLLSLWYPAHILEAAEEVCPCDVPHRRRRKRAIARPPQLARARKSPQRTAACSSAQQRPAAPSSTQQLGRAPAAAPLDWTFPDERARAKHELAA